MKTHYVGISQSTYVFPRHFHQHLKHSFMLKVFLLEGKAVRECDSSNKAMLFRISVAYCREKHLKIVSDEICALKGHGYISCLSYVLVNVPFPKLPDSYRIT